MKRFAMLLTAVLLSTLLLDCARPDMREILLCKALSQFAYTAADRVSCGKVSDKSSPVIELNVTGSASDALVVFISGDGGWAEIDQGIARELNRQGVAVVGVNSLWYFWNSKTPDQLAADLKTISTSYMRRWQKHHLYFAGFSQGADVLPFAINRFPKTMREHIDAVTLLAAGVETQFEIHPANWLADDIDRDFKRGSWERSLAQGFLKLFGGKHDGRDIRPEVERLVGVDAICAFGAKEDSSGCHFLAPAATFEFSGGHHLTHDYAVLAKLIARESHVPQKMMRNAA